MDLATDEQDARASDTLMAAATAANATSTETAAPPDESDSGAATVSRTPSNNVGSASWLLQVMGALGAAVAVGSIAWFLIGSASPWTVSISEAIRGTTEVRLKLRNGARYIRECFGSRWRGFRRRGLPTMAPAHERPAPGRLAAVGPEFE
jgi:hypothetical protein